MPLPSLDLPRIPAATIMELRTKGGLETASQDSKESYSYDRTGAWLNMMGDEAVDTMYWDRDEHRAFNVGVKIGQAVGYRLIDRDVPDAYEHIESAIAIETLNRKFTTSPSFTRFLKDRVDWIDRTEEDRSRTLQLVAANTLGARPKLSETFDSISRVHIGERADLLCFARYGAAAIHSTVYAIDVQRHNRILNPSATSAGHLDLAL